MDNTEKKLTCLSLCSGYGGIELGLGLAGIQFERVVYVEREAFAAANLAHKIETGELAPGVIHTDVKTFPYQRFRNCFDFITGGFPCQPFSNAGKHFADEDPRHLFPHIKNAIRIVRPTWVFLENVEAIISAKLKSDEWADPVGTPVLLHVCRELERVGYEVAWGAFSAAEIGASHRRKRVFILAYSNCKGLQGCWRTVNFDAPKERKIEERCITKSRAFMFPRMQGREQYAWEEPRQYQPKLVRTNNGAKSGMDATPNPLANRIERLQIIGNGVVPQTAAKAWLNLSKQLKESRTRSNK